MITTLNHLPVNWEDGMKIKRSHFLEMEDNFRDELRDSNFITITDYSFGLLPENEPGQDPVIVEVSPELIEIFKCRAVTRGGIRIEIINQEIAALKKPLMELMGERDFSGSEEWYIILKVDPFKREPFGTPNPDEQPLRHPHTTPKYELDIISGDMINSVQFMISSIPVAKILSSYNKGIEEDRSYIPPCTRICSSSRLTELFHSFEKKVTEIEGDVFATIRRAREKSSKGSLAPEIEFFSTHLYSYINSNIDEYKLILKEQPPVYLLVWFKRMARAFRSSFNLIKGEEIFSTYFNKFIGSNFETRVFLNAVDLLCQSQYNHLDIKKSFEPISDFLNILGILYSQLNKLNFEEVDIKGILMPKNTSNRSGGIKIDPNKRNTRGGGSLL